MKLKSLPPKEPFYVIINSMGEVYTGVLGGRFQWSNDWDKAKPLKYSSTACLHVVNSKLELIEESEFNK